MLTLRPQWLLVGLLGACGSPDIAETGPSPSVRVTVCTKVYSFSGFALGFALDASSAAELEGATVSLCRDGDRCFAGVMHAPGMQNDWTCGEPNGPFACSVAAGDESLFISTNVDVNYDPGLAPLVDGDVWRGALTDAEGRLVLRFEQAVEYTAICRNGSPPCGISYQASACVSDGEAVCPAFVSEHPYAC